MRPTMVESMLKQLCDKPERVGVFSIITEKIICCSPTCNDPIFHDYKETKWHQFDGANENVDIYR